MFENECGCLTCNESRDYIVQQLQGKATPSPSNRKARTKPNINPYPNSNSGPLQPYPNQWQKAPASVEPNTTKVLFEPHRCSTPQEAYVQGTIVECKICKSLFRKADTGQWERLTFNNEKGVPFGDPMEVLGRD